MNFYHDKISENRSNAVANHVSGQRNSSTSLAKQPVVQRKEIRDFGGEQTKQWYGNAIAATGTADLIPALNESGSEGSGIYLSDDMSEWSHATRIGRGNDIMKLVVPNITAIQKDKTGYPDRLANNGQTVEQNCAMVAEHELIHLKHAHVNLKKGIKNAGTGVAEFSDANIEKTINGLIADAGELPKLQIPVRLETARGFIIHRLGYILTDWRRNRRNSEAPAVLRELRLYLGNTEIIKASDERPWHTFKQQIEALDKACSDAIGIAAPTKEGCFITTACIEAMGLDDDCRELIVLRAFRDGYLMDRPDGGRLVKLYYEYSPYILQAIRRREDEEEILKRLYKVIEQCVFAIERQNYEFSFKKYCEMVTTLADQFIPHLVTEIKMKMP